MVYQTLSIKGEIYVRRHEISRGGMGEIVLYEHNKNPNKTIVVKSPIIKGEMVDEFFENEAELMYMLNEEPEQEDIGMPDLLKYLKSELGKKTNPCFPQLIEYRKRNSNDPESRPFIAMTHEHRARNLEDILRSMKRNGVIMPFSYIINIMKDVYDSVTRIHQQGYLHNDLNLRNSGFGKDVLLFDLGISSKIGKKLDPAITGTITYTSPELDEKKELDEKSDSYSTGIMLYELATGINPLRDLPTAISLIDPRALNSNERARIRSKQRELKRRLHVGNYKLINPIEEYRNDKIPKGFESLIRDLTDPKPKNRPTPTEARYELNRISKKSRFTKVTNDEIARFMKTYMNVIYPESLKELEEDAKASKGFTIRYEEDDLSKIESSSQSQSSNSYSMEGSKTLQ